MGCTNYFGQLGHHYRPTKPAPALVESLESVCCLATDSTHSLAVTQLEVVFSRGRALPPEVENKLRLIIVEGGEVGCVR